MSTTELTTAAAWIAGMAIIALIAAGWRKPARATADPARARRPGRAVVGVRVHAVEAPMYEAPPWWRRLWAAVAGSGLAIVLGGVLATVIGFGGAWIVITLSKMLKR